MSIRKKVMFALFALSTGLASAVSATSSACIECDNAFWRCGGAQNDYCTMRYEICLRKNGCENPFL